MKANLLRCNLIEKWNRKEFTSEAPFLLNKSSKGLFIHPLLLIPSLAIWITTKYILITNSLNPGGWWQSLTHSDILTMQHLNCGQQGRCLSETAPRQQRHLRTETHIHKHMYSSSVCPHNTYSPIIERGRGLGPALPVTLLQDRLMRRSIAPADQITPFWSSLPGLEKICKCSLFLYQSSFYFSTFTD